MRLNLLAMNNLLAVGMATILGWVVFDLCLVVDLNRSLSILAGASFAALLAIAYCLQSRTLATKFFWLFIAFLFWVIACKSYLAGDQFVAWLSMACAACAILHEVYAIPSRTPGTRRFVRADSAAREPGSAMERASVQAPIEPAVRPLCEALNAIPEVRTLSSCEGHPERWAHPFVIFLASPATALHVHRMLDLELMINSRLRFHWHLSCAFRDDGTLQYTIEPNDYRVTPDPSVCWWGMRRRWNRVDMNADLNELARLVVRALGVAPTTR